MSRKIVTMNVSLPATLRQELEKKLDRHAYGSASEYVRELIRRDLQQEGIAKVDALLLEGLQSGPPVPVTEKWWKDRYAALARHRRPRTRKKR